MSKKEKLALEFSCSNIEKCPMKELENFEDSLCKGWCSHFVWNAKDFPSKPEFFSKTQLRTMVEKLGDGDLIKVKQTCWNLTEGITALAGENKNILLPKNLYLAFKKLKAYTEEKNDKFLDWFLVLADIRDGLRVFLRVLEKQETKIEK